MADVEYLKPTPFGDGEILFAQGAKAGPWIFFTGHEATDFTSGIAPDVAGKPGLPLAGLSRYRREGDHIVKRLTDMVKAAGSDLRHIVRVDQYYPTHLAVNPYQRARKAVLGDYVPPSTSVLMEELLVEGANMNVSMLAVMPGGGREPRDARADDVPVPQHSGFIPSLVSGDFVFVAGQMTNNEAMTGLAPEAYKAPNALWNGTPIRLQTEYMIKHRLEPALRAGGSSLANAIKAQVYLTRIEDLPEFMDVWNAYFGKNPCALTVVACKGLGLLECDIEINIFGVRDDARTKKTVIDHPASGAMRLGPAAVRAGDLVCLSALYAADDNGAVPESSAAGALHRLGVPARQQMRVILDATDEICRQAGTSLANLVRAHHFVADLGNVYPALRVWNERRPGLPLPFAAVRTPAPLSVPGCRVVVDPWFYGP